MNTVKLQDIINTEKSLAFLYTNNEKTEREIKETIPFTIATKRKVVFCHLSRLAVFSGHWSPLWSIWQFLEAFLVATFVWVATDIEWVKTRDYAKHIKLHRTVHRNKNYLAPNINNAERNPDVDQWFFRTSSSDMQHQYQLGTCWPCTLSKSHLGLPIQSGPSICTLTNSLGDSDTC